jgi:hypothetical protein
MRELDFQSLLGGFGGGGLAGHGCSRILFLNRCNSDPVQVGDPVQLGAAEVSMGPQGGD